MINNVIFDESFLYSRGKYWLFEHWQEDGKNIYSKCKYGTEAEFLTGAGGYLTQDQINELKNESSLNLKNEDGTTYFFKFVNIP